MKWERLQTEILFIVEISDGLPEAKVGTAAFVHLIY